MINLLAIKSTQLKSALSSTALTARVKEFADRHGNLPTFASLNTDWFVIVVKQGDVWEQIKITNYVQETDGSCTLTIDPAGRHILPISPYTGSATGFEFGVIAEVIVTNDMLTMNEYARLGNNNAFTGYNTVPDPISAQGIVSRDYMLALINGGAISVEAIIEAGNAGENVVAGNLLYFSETDNEWLKTDADTLATLFNVKLGIAQGAGVNGGAITGGVLTKGSYITSGLTQGDLCYASNTAGGINSGTSGTVPRVIGIAKSSTVLYFDPDFQNVLYRFAVSATGNDTYLATYSGAYSVPFLGMDIFLKVDVGNTGACSLNGIGIKKNVTQDLATGDILAGQVIHLSFDGTYYQLISNIVNLFGDFGDGSDGDVTISTPTTLTRDMYYNNLVVTDTLNTANWRIFVKGTLSGAGIIQNNGGDGGNGGTPTAGSAGAKVPDGYFSTLAGYIGGVGINGGSQNGNNGTNGGASSSSIGVVGVAGGSGEDVSVFTGGTGGTAGALTAILQKFGILLWQTISAIDFALNGTSTKYNGSSGSGSGGAGAGRNNGNTHTTGGGGGSGAPAGVIAIFANIWAGSFTIKALGGNGGNGGDGTATGADLAGGGGGGAGGSGGFIYVVYKIKTWTGSHLVTGGTGGTKGSGSGSSGGSNGATGTTGTSVEINIATLL